MMETRTALLRTTVLPPSGSEAASSFDRLHPAVRRWIWEQKWEELRDVQARTIAAVLDGGGDVLVAASTAAGKTEAAFLPVLTQVAERREPGFSVLYVSPLKALINDQFRRLDQLCERMGIDVVRWHGDAPEAAKLKARRDPRGVVLITPESIEAMLVRRPGDAKAMLGSLSFVVIDELHAFLNGPRGLHLVSLLRRLDAMSAQPARRLGLSATVGDLAAAARWLRPHDPSGVAIVESASEGAELRLQVRAYADERDADETDGLEDDSGKAVALDRIADHLFATLRGSNNLVFAGSRRRVESLADRLRTRSDRAGVPNEFLPHHGSLSRELREGLEERLKNGDLPTSAVATTTLELGIDLGSVKSVAQVGAPRSLASLRQRLGRSGRRRGVPAILRVYVRERDLAADSDPLDHLRLETARAVAAVRLLVDRFVEPPSADGATATVVLHQTLSVICQEGGRRADKLYDLVCGSGPLSALGKADYAGLLRAMASPEARLIEQATDGSIMLGEAGERLTASREFYAIFPSDEEWRLVSGGRSLGTMPISNPVGVGTVLAFAGQRWRIAAVDDRAKVLEVERHRSGRIPRFDSLMGEPVHDRLAAEMRSVLSAADMPRYLDPSAAEFLRQGRAAFAALGLDMTRVLAAGKDTHVLTWRGTAANSVLAFALASEGLECVALDIGVTALGTTPEGVTVALAGLADRPPDVETVSGRVANLRTAKFDELVPENLLRRLWGRAHTGVVAEVGEIARVCVSSSHLA